MRSSRHLSKEKYQYLIPHVFIHAFLLEYITLSLFQSLRLIFNPVKNQATIQQVRAFSKLRNSCPKPFVRQYFGEMNSVEKTDVFRGISSNSTRSLPNR